MKGSIKNNILLIIVTLVIASCKGEKFIPSSMGAINVIHGISGGKNVKLNANAIDSVVSNNFKVFSIITGDTKISFYPSGSPSNPYYNQTLQTNMGDLYSLYLGGTPASVDAVLVKENFATYTAEELAVRAVNLSANSSPIKVTLVGLPGVAEFNNLAYKQISDFKKYAAPMTAVASNFSFQVRNASTDALLATYTFTAANLTNSRFRNVTLVFRGLIGGTGTSAPGITFVPNY